MINKMPYAQSCVRHDTSKEVTTIIWWFLLKKRRHIISIPPFTLTTPINSKNTRENIRNMAQKLKQPRKGQVLRLLLLEVDEIFKVYAISG